MLFHQLFRQGKLEANRKQNYIYKTKFHCSPRTENQIISVKPSFTVRPARRVSLVLLEAYRSPCSKCVARPARSVLLAPPEACYSPRSKRVARPARSVLLALLGTCCSPCSEGTSHSVRMVHLTPLGGCRSSCSEGAVPKVIMYASTIKSEKYFRNIGDKSRAGIGVYFVEYGVNFRLRKCHYCKSRF